jgi:putative transposase
MNRPNRIIKIEKLAVRKDGFCVSSLGNNMKTTCNNLNFLENMHTVAIVRYCNGKYHILFKYPTKNKSKKELTNKTVAIDPGMRKFGMGYSNDKVISLCETSKYKIIKKLENIDKISKSNLEEHKKQKAKNKRFTKIKNMVTDMHWKTINYLTSNYDTILIGNMSTKQIVENDNINKMVKRVLSMYKMYSFKQKLIYKCRYLGIKYKEVDEAYTSKSCCRCASVNNKLNGSEIFSCDKCNIVIDRDINGAINILQRSVI